MNIVPSIELIPAKYGVGTLLTQVPMDVSGDFVVSGATTPTADLATRVNSQGFIETVLDNVPRLDYLQSDGSIGCPALLVEPAATNLILRSDQFDNAYWAKGVGGVASAPVVTANAEISPDGTMNADRVVFNLNGGTSSADLSQLETPTITYAAAAHTQSIYARTTDGTTKVFTFVLPSGAVQPITITPTYQRFILTSALAGSGAFRLRLRGNEATASSATIAIWGAQLEAGSVATSYIPTTTTGITRGANVINKTGVSGLIGQTEGTMYAEFEYKTNIAERRLIALSNGTASDRIMLWTLNNILYAQVEAGSIILASPITEGYHKVAFAYQQSGVSGTLFASLDGGGVVSGTSAAFPASLTDINIGKNEATATSSFFWNARIRAAAIYKTRLPNYLLESATSQIQSYSALASSLSYTVV
jgi:hypothetical protein